MRLVETSIPTHMPPQSDVESLQSSVVTYPLVPGDPAAVFNGKNAQSLSQVTGPWVIEGIYC